MKYHRHPLTKQQLSNLGSEPIFKMGQGTVMLIITLIVAAFVMTIVHFAKLGNW